MQPQLPCIDDKDRIRRWRRNKRRGHNQLAAVYRLDDATLHGAALRADHQRITGYRAGAPVSGDRPDGGVIIRYAPAVYPTGHAFICKGEHGTGHVGNAVQPRLNGDDAVKIIGIHRPATAPLRLALACAAYGRYLRLLKLELLHQVREHHRRGAVLIVVIRVAEVNQCAGITVLLAAAGVRGFIHHRGAGEDLQLRGIDWHIGDNIEHVVAPERHAIEAGGDIFDHLPCIGLRLDVDVEHEARLCAAAPFTVRNQLIATLCDAVKLPFIQHVRRDAAAEAKARLGQDIKPDPRRIIRPPPLKRAIPCAGVGSRYRIVI